MQCACTTLPSVPCPHKPYFSNLSHKQHDFRKKGLLKNKKCVLVFCKIFPEIYLIISDYIWLYFIICHYISLCLIISHSILILSHISLYLGRTDNTTLPKHALNYKTRGRRNRGRCRKRRKRVDARTGQATECMEEDDDGDDDDISHSKEHWAICDQNVCLYIKYQIFFWDYKET